MKIELTLKEMRINEKKYNELIKSRKKLQELQILKISHYFFFMFDFLYVLFQKIFIRIFDIIITIILHTVNRDYDHLLRILNLRIVLMRKLPTKFCDIKLMFK